jgi:ADP-ribose pyrophosphatase YjhB (NUDIX family)
MLAVGAVVVAPDQRVLLVRRARAPSRGAWTLPGGKVEPGEPLMDAVVREVREETALDVRVVASLGVVRIEREGFVYDIHEHLCVPLDDRTPRASDDADDLRWATPDELPALLRPDAIAVVERGLTHLRETPV